MATPLLAISLVAAGAGGAAAQDDAGEGGDPVDLRFTLWIPADAPHMDVFNLIKEEYEAENPNVTIEYDFIPFGDYESKVTLQLSGGDPPDAGWLVERSAPTFTGAGVLADLGPTLTADDAYDLDDFSDGAMALWADENAIHGVPFSTSPFLIIYNASLFEEAGLPLPDELVESGEWTWERVAELAGQIKESTGSYGLQSNDATLYTGNPWTTILPVMMAHGGTAWDSENRCGFADEGSVAGLSLLHDMIFDAGSMVPPGTEVDFYAGDAGMTIGQLSRVGRLGDADFGWGIAPLPSGPDGNADIIGQAAITAFARGDNPEVAADFVKFLTTAENVTRLSAFFPPARESVMSSQDFYDANPLLDAETIQSVVAPAIQSGSVLPAHEQFAVIDLNTIPLLDGLWTADADVAAKAAEVCDTIQPLLDS